MPLCLQLSPEAVKGLWLACSPSVSASRKDWLWKLQSNSCNYLQSVDNRGPTKRLLTRKHGAGRDVSRGTEGKISQGKKRKMVATLVLPKKIKSGCKVVINTRSNHEAADQCTNQTRKVQQQRTASKAFCCLLSFVSFQKCPFPPLDVLSLYVLFIKCLYESDIKKKIYSEKETLYGQEYLSANFFVKNRPTFHIYLNMQCCA